ncbi:tetratricopeptide repeat-containing sensor histidine kinase [Hufsiella ginkgonis]|uniref:histidine kinase n=1 Tax=Hufsiella ginkgonis TaxID=2695274 RepID=A0A7K1XVB1_9SPHI|nr:ATP-binding protein [Hufsiella ginkgonis]MXV14943.1 hypothetical protein [Hufsiella ginkgonis]
MSCLTDAVYRCSYVLVVLLLVVGSSCDRTPGKAKVKDPFAGYIATANKHVGEDLERVFRYVDSMYRSTPDHTVLEKLGYYNFCSANYFNVFHDNARAVAYSDSMVAIIEKDNNQEKYPELAVLGYISRGETNFAAGRYNVAYNAFFKTKLLVRQTLDSCALSDYNYRLGMVLYKQQRYHKAAAYFKEAFDGLGTCPDKKAVFWRRQEILNNTALSYSKTELIDSAFLYYDKALAFISSGVSLYDDPFMINLGKAVMYGNQGDVFLKKGDSLSAERLYLKSAKMNSQQGYEVNDMMFTRIKLARLYKEEGRKNDMYVQLQLVRNTLDTLDNREVRTRWNELMNDYYSSVDQPANAYPFLKEYNRLKDSARISTRQLLSGDANVQLQSLEKQYEIDILKKNTQLQRLYLHIVITISVLTLVILFLIYKYWRRSKENVKSLASLNETVKQQNEALGNTLAALKLSSLEKDRILRAVAHDLRNPIGGIASVSELMLSEPDAPLDQREELLGLINSTCTDSLLLINEILEAANTQDAGNMPLQPVEINTVITNCIELLRFRAAEKAQDLSGKLGVEPLELHINREKIGRVVNNLISNAIKFSPRGSTIVVSTHNQPHKLLISVKDNGIGIPAEIQPKIFDMFTSARRKGTTGEKPFGLGLSISKQIVEAHKGRIWFDSEEGKGTTFFVELRKNH